MHSTDLRTWNLGVRVTLLAVGKEKRDRNVDCTNPNLATVCSPVLGFIYSPFPSPPLSQFFPSIAHSNPPISLFQSHLHPSLSPSPSPPSPSHAASPISSPIPQHQCPSHPTSRQPNSPLLTVPLTPSFPCFPISYSLKPICSLIPLSQHSFLPSLLHPLYQSPSSIFYPFL